MTTPTAETFLARLDRLERMAKQAEHIGAPGTAGIDEVLSSTNAPGDLGLAVMQAATRSRATRSKARHGRR